MLSASAAEKTPANGFIPVRPAGSFTDDPAGDRIMDFSTAGTWAAACRAPPFW